MEVFSSIKPRESWEAIFKKGKGIIIDLGCGYGADSYYLTKKGYKVIAIDKENNLKFSHKNISFRQQKIEKLIKGKFDGVIANFSLQYLPPEKRIAVVKHYLACLRPGGAFYILLFNKFLSKALFNLFKDNGRIEHYTIKDNHPPYGNHIHHITKIIYIKSNDAS